MYNNKRCVLIVDDEQKMVKALSDLLISKGYTVLKAFDGIDALTLYYENNKQIDIILLDVMLPLKNGFDVLKALREYGDTVPVIMLTARGEEYDELNGFSNGADDYITKPFSSSLLLARIESVLKRSGIGDDSVIKENGIEINIAKHNVTSDGIAVELTPREFDLLHYLVINKNISLSREKILSSVWGYEYDGDIRTVDTHIKQLRIKLPAKADFIQTIHRIGYRFEVLNEKVN